MTDEHLGPIVACSSGHGACRIGSQYHSMFAGKCDRCGEEMTIAAVTRVRNGIEFMLTEAGMKTCEEMPPRTPEGTATLTERMLGRKR